MAYKDNVQALCSKLGIKNPIQEDDLTIAGLIFTIAAEGSGKPETFLVEATDMNRAGRLFIQSVRHGMDSFMLISVRDRAREFFTSELWGDCGPDKRPLVYGIKTCVAVEIIHK